MNKSNIEFHCMLSDRTPVSFKHTSPGVLDGSLTKAPWPCPPHMISRSIEKKKVKAFSTQHYNYQKETI